MKSSNLAKPISAILTIVLVGAAEIRATDSLLPFQGRVSNAQGAPLPDGHHVIRFRISESPVDNTFKWPGELHRATVNGGLINLVLGTKTPLEGVDFSRQLFLEVTVDTGGKTDGSPNGIIDDADPPMLPRQSILPAVFAVEAQQSRSLKAGDGMLYDWSALFGVQSPATGTIPVSRISIDKGIPTSAIAKDNGLTADQLAANSVETSELRDSSVTAAKLSADVITPAGAVSAFIGDRAPTGWLLCDGSEVDRAGLYAKLAEVVGTRFGTAVDRLNKFKLPDFRGYFLRGVDGSADRDPDKAGRTPMATGGATGNAVGSVQGDAMQGHHHALYHETLVGVIGGTSGVLVRPSNLEAQNVSGPTKAVKEPTSNGAHGIPRVSSETRPTNAYVNYIIKY